MRFVVQSVVNCVSQDSQSAGLQYNSDTSLTLTLAMLCVLFVTITVVFSFVLLQPSDRRRSGCHRSVDGTGRPVPAAFERLQTATERSCRGAGDDSQMLVVVGRRDELHNDAVKVASDDDDSV